MGTVLSTLGANCKCPLTPSCPYQCLCKCPMHCKQVTPLWSTGHNRKGLPMYEKAVPAIKSYGVQTLSPYSLLSCCFSETDTAQSTSTLIKNNIAAIQKWQSIDYTHPNVEWRLLYLRLLENLTVQHVHSAKVFLCMKHTDDHEIWMR